ncbi:MAG: translation initiation factor IF-3 [Acidobacteriota bacterium]
MKARVNFQIRAKEIRVIDEDGTQLGIMTPDDARSMADARGFDLVEVSPTARPPVCRIMDYGKFRYEQSKKVQETKKKQKTVQVKEIKFRPKIDEHDYNFKKNRAIRFLKADDKVKATIMFRGREVTHPELGRQILERLRDELSELAEVERPPKLEGYNMVMILQPKRD